MSPSVPMGAARSMACRTMHTAVGGAPAQPVGGVAAQGADSVDVDRCSIPAPRRRGCGGKWSTYPAPPAAAESVRWLLRILLASFHVSRISRSTRRTHGAAVWECEHGGEYGARGR